MPFPLNGQAPFPYFHLLLGFVFSSGSHTIAGHYSKKGSSWKLLITTNIVNWGNSSKSNIKVTIQSRSENQVYIAKSFTAIKMLGASPISDFWKKFGICPGPPLQRSRSQEYWKHKCGYRTQAVLKGGLRCHHPFCKVQNSLDSTEDALRRPLHWPSIPSHANPTSFALQCPRRHNKKY